MCADGSWSWLRPKASHRDVMNDPETVITNDMSFCTAKSRATAIVSGQRDINIICVVV